MILVMVPSRYQWFVQDCIYRHTHQLVDNGVFIPAGHSRTRPPVQRNIRSAPKAAVYGIPITDLSTVASHHGHRPSDVIIEHRHPKYILNHPKPLCSRFDIENDS